VSSFPYPCVVFDLGGVLLHYRPKQFLGSLFPPGKAEALYRLVFESAEWKQLDLGTMGILEAFAEWKARSPALVGELSVMQQNWLSMLQPITENVQMLPRLQQAGVKVYGLSNFHREAFSVVRNLYPFFSHFDHILVSSHVHLAKPDPRIFRLFLQQTGQQPEDCPFFDDGAQNVHVARELGFPAFLVPNGKQIALLAQHFLET